jgi:deoxyribodipyrimidine photo-lyase
MSATGLRFKAGLMWFRRDLRWRDNAALHHALTQCDTVHCVFVFDSDILDALPRADRRVEFIRESLVELDADLRQASGNAAAGLIVLHPVAGRRQTALDGISALARELQVNAVFANHDDEPASTVRDAAVRTALTSARIAHLTFKDHVIFERAELLTQSGTPYGVFTPYKNAWHKAVSLADLAAHESVPLAFKLAARPAHFQRAVPTLDVIGFSPRPLLSAKQVPGCAGANALLDDFAGRIDRYHEWRDFPAAKGPSYLSVHLRFGTVSIRTLARTAHAKATSGNPGAVVWLNELIWRDFYHQVMFHHPHAMGHSFRPEYDAIEWEHGAHADALFSAWCKGETGYPLVDAAMAQLNQTGYMHNRLRMVVASFLVKDLGIDWRWGEAYFARQLLDFDLAANNGGWQWASSSGCDAQPYFRIFNPITQSEKFDPEGKFIRRYLPQLSGLSNADLHAPWKAAPLVLAGSRIVLGEAYPTPIVQHDAARAKTLNRYAVVKKPAR